MKETRLANSLDFDGTMKKIVLTYMKLVEGALIP